MEDSRTVNHETFSTWNYWKEFNETWQEVRSQRPLPSLYFSTDKKQDDRPGPCLAETSETAERNSTKPDRMQDLNVLYQVCVFRAYQKNKMAALVNLSIRWHIVPRCTICGPLGPLLYSWLRTEGGFGSYICAHTRPLRTRGFLQELIFFGLIN